MMSRTRNNVMTISYDRNSAILYEAIHQHARPDETDTQSYKYYFKYTRNYLIYCFITNRFLNIIYKLQHKINLRTASIDCRNYFGFSPSHPMNGQNICGFSKFHSINGRNSLGFSPSHPINGRNNIRFSPSHPQTTLAVEERLVSGTIPVQTTLYMN